MHRQASVNPWFTPIDSPFKAASNEVNLLTVPHFHTGSVCSYVSTSNSSMPSETSSLSLSLCCLPFFVLVFVPLVQSCLLLKSGKYAVVIYGHASNLLFGMPCIFHVTILSCGSSVKPISKRIIWCGRVTPHRCTASQGERTENSKFQKLSGKTDSQIRSQTLLFCHHRQQSEICEYNNPTCSTDGQPCSDFTRASAQLRTEAWDYLGFKHGEPPSRHC